MVEVGGVGELIISGRDMMWGAGKSMEGFAHEDEQFVLHMEVPWEPVGVV